MGGRRTATGRHEDEVIISTKDKQPMNFSGSFFLNVHLHSRGHVLIPDKEQKLRLSNNNTSDNIFSTRIAIFISITIKQFKRWTTHNTPFYCIVHKTHNSQ